MSSIDLTIKNIDLAIKDIDFQYPLKVKSIRNKLNNKGLKCNKRTVIWYLNHNLNEYSIVKPLQVGSNKYFINLWTKKDSDWDRRNKIVNTRVVNQDIQEV